MNARFHFFDPIKKQPTPSMHILDGIVEYTIRRAMSNQYINVGDIGPEMSLLVFLVMESCVVIVHGKRRTKNSYPLNLDVLMFK